MAVDQFLAAKAEHGRWRVVEEFTRQRAAALRGERDVSDVRTPGAVAEGVAVGCYGTNSKLTSLRARSFAF